MIFFKRVKKPGRESGLIKIANLLDSDTFSILADEIEAIMETAYLALAEEKKMDEIVRLQAEISVLSKILKLKNKYRPLNRGRQTFVKRDLAAQGLG